MTIIPRRWRFEADVDRVSCSLADPSFPFLPIPGIRFAPSPAVRNALSVLESKATRRLDSHFGAK
jgi:hypothetical protein